MDLDDESDAVSKEGTGLGILLDNIGEKVEVALKGRVDWVVFTTHRVILVDQMHAIFGAGKSGQNFFTIPYNSLVRYQVETAGG